MECGAYAKTVAFLSLTCKKCAVTKVTPNGGGFVFRSVRVPQVSRFSRPGGFRSVNLSPAGCPAASQFSRPGGFAGCPRSRGFRDLGVLPGAPGLAVFETWGFSLRKRIASRVPRSLAVFENLGVLPGAPGLAPFETWGFRPGLSCPTALIRTAPPPVSRVPRNHHRRACGLNERAL